MGRAGDISTYFALEPIEPRRVALAAGLAFLVHCLLFLVLSRPRPSLPSFKAPEAISVKLLPFIQAPQDPSQAIEPERKLSPAPKPIAEPEPLTELIPQTQPDPQAAAPAVRPQILTRSPAITGLSRIPAEPINPYADSRWALDPPLAKERLKSLGLFDDAECLRSLSEDCAALRKEVFAEYELTEMERVWTPTRADTGMPSEFYGLSEREILRKLGSNIAGENGIYLLPGIGIDGQLWDFLHGVKKGCEMKRGINSDGKYGVVRVCPEMLPAARNRKYYIPPKD